MKTAFTLTLVAGMAVVASLHAGPPFRIAQNGQVDPEALIKAAKAPASVDRVTDEELAKVKADSQIEYGRGFRPTEKEMPAPTGDYYANSIILSDGTDHTVLPHSAIIHLPEEYAKRVLEAPVGKLVLWPEFFKRNRIWIRTHEVTLETATGEKPIPANIMQNLTGPGMVVVGVMRTFPISVLPPAEAGTESEPSESLTKK